MQNQGDISWRVIVEESERTGARGQERIGLQIEQDETDESLFYG